MLGIECFAFSQETDAIAAVEGQCDVAIIDDLQSDADGYDLARKLRTQNPTLPIILIASNTGVAEADPARDCVSHILQKPVPRHLLFKALTDLAPQDTVKPLKPVLFHARKRETPITEELKTGRKLRVLAAEDNKTNQLVFRKMLKHLDIELTFADNGEDAVSLYQNLAPDIVFMDISMPKMDGKTATRAIRKLEVETNKHVPIVAMTAHAMAGDQDEILSAGLDHYLTKPLKKARVIEHITRLEIVGVCAVLND